MDAILYAITGLVTAIVVAVPCYALCLAAEWIYNNNPKIKKIIDRIA